MKPYVCIECPKRFYTAAELRQHHPVHLGYKQFSCGLCDRLYKRKRAVKIHFKKCSAEHDVTGVVLWWYQTENMQFGMITFIICYIHVFAFRSHSVITSSNILSTCLHYNNSLCAVIIRQQNYSTCCMLIVQIVEAAGYKVHRVLQKIHTFGMLKLWLASTGFDIFLKNY